MEHEEGTADCWCEPVIIPVNEARVIIHVEADGLQPPLSALVEAIRLAQED